MSLRHSAAASFAVLATAALPAAATPAQPELVAQIHAAADTLQASTNKYCAPQYDGDKSKGEHTNADVAALVRGWTRIPERAPGLSLEVIASIATGIAADNYTICFDKRNQALSTSNVPPEGHHLLATQQIQGVLYAGAETLTLSPTPVNPADTLDTSTAMLFGIDRLSKCVTIFNSLRREAEVDRQFGNIQGAQEKEMQADVYDAPLVYLYNKTEPARSSFGPSLDTRHLMFSPIIRPQSRTAHP